MVRPRLGSTVAAEYYCSRFAESGFNGSFCADRHMNLGKLIPSTFEAGFEVIREEHIDVPPGEFGASETEFRAENYKVTTSPAQEHAFAYLHPRNEQLPNLSLGIDPLTGEDLGCRTQRKAAVDWRSMQNTTILCNLMNTGLRECGIGYELTKQEVGQFGMQGWEFMCITLYTGPMFELCVAQQPMSCQCVAIQLKRCSNH